MEPQISPSPRHCIPVTEATYSNCSCVSTSQDQLLFDKLLLSRLSCLPIKYGNLLCLAVLGRESQLRTRLQENYWPWGGILLCRISRARRFATSAEVSPWGGPLSSQPEVGPPKGGAKTP